MFLRDHLDGSMLRQGASMRRNQVCKRRPVGGKVRRVEEIQRPHRSGSRLSIEERTHFMFGAVTLDVLIERLQPTIVSLADTGIVRPQEVSHWLNARGLRTARGDNWSTALVAVLLELLRDQSGDRIVWNQMTADLAEKAGQGSLGHRPNSPKPEPPRGLGTLSGLTRNEEFGGPARWRQKGRAHKKRQRLASAGAQTSGRTAATPWQPKTWKYAPADFTQRSVVGLRDQWLNCIQRLDAPSDEFPEREVKKLLDAIEKEWRRRTGPGSRPDDYFRWPSTDAEIGIGSLSDPGQWLSEGLLRFLHYSVGRRQEGNERSRRVILAAVFDGDLPPFHSAEYMLGWGMPGTACRLKKIASSLAAFARNAKRKRLAELTEAIADWEADMKFLNDTYYVGHFHFAWPSL